MRKPKFSRQELWQRLLTLDGKTINSLTGRKSHTIAFLHNNREEYIVVYESGNTAVISLDEVHALYTELYAKGRILNIQMHNDCKRILGWTSWHAPGSALLAIMPRLDNQIGSEGANLYIAGN